MPGGKGRRVQNQLLQSDEKGGNKEDMGPRAAAGALSQQGPTSLHWLKGSSDLGHPKLGFIVGGSDCEEHITATGRHDPKVTICWNVDHASATSNAPSPVGRAVPWYDLIRPWHE